MITIEEDGTAYVDTAVEAIQICDRKGVKMVRISDPVEQVKLDRLSRALGDFFKRGK
jgi:hypothetical protein